MAQGDGGAGPNLPAPVDAFIAVRSLVDRVTRVMGPSLRVTALLQSAMAPLQKLPDAFAPMQRLTATLRVVTALTSRRDPSAVPPDEPWPWRSYAERNAGLYIDILTGPSSITDKERAAWRLVESGVFGPLRDCDKPAWCRRVLEVADEAVCRRRSAVYVEGKPALKGHGSKRAVDLGQPRLTRWFLPRVKAKIGGKVYQPSVTTRAEKSAKKTAALTVAGLAPERRLVPPTKHQETPPARGTRRRTRG
jgi:hypothetical protein